MKKSLILIIIILFTAIGYTLERNPFFIYSSYDSLEKYNAGTVNWTEGYVIAKSTTAELINKGITNLSEKLKSNSGRHEIMDELMQLAKQNLLNTLLEVKIDSSQKVKDYFETNSMFKTIFLEEFEKNIILLPSVYLNPAEIESVVKYPLYGKGSLSDLIYRLDDNEEDIPKYLNDDTPREPITYSSIIIDLRYSFKFIMKTKEYLENLPKGLLFPLKYRDRINYDRQKKSLTYHGVMSIEERDDFIALAPKDSLYKNSILELYEQSQQSEKEINFISSLFPTIYDSNDKLILSKDMVKLKKRPNAHFVTITKDGYIYFKIEKVGKNPLYILADKIKGEFNSDIILNKEDTQKLFLNKKTMENIRNGKLYIIVK